MDEWHYDKIMCPDTLNNILFLFLFSLVKVVVQKLLFTQHFWKLKCGQDLTLQNWKHYKTTGLRSPLEQQHLFRLANDSNGDNYRVHSPKRVITRPYARVRQTESGP